MGVRGRASAASLAVVSVMERPAPPAELTPEQRDEWVAVINSLPAAWFSRSTYGLLTQYCRHVVAARRIGDLIRAAEGGAEFDIEEYDRLLKMQEREGRAMSSLATRMRISQQSTYDKTKKKAALDGSHLWRK